MKTTIITMIAFVSICFIYGFYSTQVDKLESELALVNYHNHSLEEQLAERREVASTRLSLNYAWPIHNEDWREGQLSSPFGERSEHEAGGLSDGYHEGLDLWGVQNGPVWQARICAVADGWVEHFLDHEVKGEYYLLHHSDGNQSEYHHVSVGYVLDGERVNRGDVLARQGDTGVSDGIHLHFELRINGEYVNPLKYIKLPEEL